MAQRSNPALPKPEPVRSLQDCVTNGERSAAHSILARSSRLQQRPNTFAQTNRHSHFSLATSGGPYMTGWRSTTHPQFGPLRNLSVLVEIVQTDAAPRTSEDMHITYEGHGRSKCGTGAFGSNARSASRTGSSCFQLDSNRFQPRADRPLGTILQTANSKTSCTDHRARTATLRIDLTAMGTTVPE